MAECLAVPRETYMGDSSTKWQATLCWLCLGVGAFWGLVAIPVLGLVPFILPMLSIPLAAIIAIRRYGGKAALIYGLLSIVLSTAWENLGVATGFPFGAYHYTLEPKLFLVPLFIAPVYSSIGFLCWSVAVMLLGDPDRRRFAGADVVITPVVAAVVMTIWDLVTDPQASTVGHTWIWEHGGRYFGVPETNFLGWLLVTYSFFQAFALYLRWAGISAAERRATFEAWPPLLFYGTLGANVIAGFAAGNKRIVVDASGKAWSQVEILGPLSIVTIFTMMFVCLLTARRITDHA